MRGGFRERDVRAAVGPTGAKSHIDAQTELAAFGPRVFNVVEHLRREEGKVLEALCRIVEDNRVLEGELGALNAVSLHLL